MALDPNALDTDKVSQPLSTGFTYRPQSQVQGFALRPEVMSELSGRLADLERYHRRPDDVSYVLY